MSGGLKRNQIQKCRACERGVMHSNQLTFYKVSVEHHVVEPAAINRLHGLEQLISPVLARAMGPDEDLSVPLGHPINFLLCSECASTKNFMEVLES